MRTLICKSRKTHRCNVAAGAVLIALSTGSVLADRYVSPSGANTAPYNSWATAAHGIQDAIDAAGSGETVWVDTATYLLDSEILVNKAIRLRGDGGAGIAILDGQDATRCLRVTDSGAQIESFGITGGRAVEGGGVYLEAGILENCSVTANLGFSSGSTGMIVRGGGVYVGGSGIVTNCTISGNLATGNWEVYGGGACLMPGAVVVDSEILGNTITNYYYETRGGGLYLAGGGSVSGCTISSNTMAATYQDFFGGGIYARSGGTIENCEILGNHAYKGGGLFLYYGGNASGLTVSNNTATLGAGTCLDHGGSIDDSDLVHNEAVYEGGGIYFWYGGTGTDLRLLANHSGYGSGAQFYQGEY